MKKMFLSPSSLFFAAGVKPGRFKSGSVLFLAVGALSVLSILAVGASRNVLLEQKMARYVTESNASYYAAQSVEKALEFIYNRKKSGLISLRDLRPRQIVLGGVTVDVRFHDEQSNINIFKAHSKDELERVPGLKDRPDLVNEIWLKTRPQIIKGRFLGGQGVREELFFLKGMNQGVYERLKYHTTVFGSGAVNMNTAQEETLYILGVRSDIVRKILKLRNDVEPEDIIEALQSVLVTDEDKAYLGLLLGFGRLVIGTQFISIEMDVRKKDRLLRSYKVVLDILSRRICEWREE